ncbi:MAG: type II toxin-antitoxin system RelE/ParE family toxin [Gammaproteobacteria bacterium]
MIKSFRHKGLERFYKTGSKAGIMPVHAKRLRLILAHLNLAEESREMGLPGLGLHPLEGDMKGFWSVSVSGNWRVIFRFEGKDAYDVNYLDYH